MGALFGPFFFYGLYLVEQFAQGTVFTYFAFVPFGFNPVYCFVVAIEQLAYAPPSPYRLHGATPMRQPW